MYRHQNCYSSVLRNNTNSFSQWERLWTWHSKTNGTFHYIWKFLKPVVNILQESINRKLILMWPHSIPLCWKMTVLASLLGDSWCAGKTEIMLLCCIWILFSWIQYSSLIWMSSYLTGSADAEKSSVLLWCKWSLEISAEITNFYLQQMLGNSFPALRW